jgi:hypothetical protein
MARKPTEKRAYVRYSARLAERIIDEISTGKKLDEICAEPGMPDRHTIRRWCIERPEFAERYETARRWSAYAMLDEINDLVDRGQEIVETAAKNGGNANAAASVLREQLNQKRWQVSKLLPAFADKVVSEISGPNGAPLIAAEPVDSKKLALALLNILATAPGDRNDPAELPALPAVTSATLLAPPIALAEPEAEPTEAMLRERSLTKIYEGVTDGGVPVVPVFDRAGRVVRLAPKGDY